MGGEERIDIKSGVWNDSFIVNLGTDALEGDDKFVHPTDLDNWHVDGDFFVRSRRQDASTSPWADIV